MVNCVEILTREQRHAMWCNERGLRPCEVDGELCAFHALGQRETCYLQINFLVTEAQKVRLLEDFRTCYYAPPGCDIKVAKEVFALVEFADGRIKEVAPDRVRLLDGRGV